MLRRERQAAKAALRVYRSGKTTNQRLAAGLTEMLELGGLYVKFAQLLLLNHEFAKMIPVELRRAIFDRVHVAEELTQYDFFKPKDTQLLRKTVAQIDDKPRFAGSFAAVFEGKLYSGKSVIIKVIRPDLRRNLRRDLRILSLMTRGVGLFKDDVNRALRDAYKGFRASTLRETNYRAEVVNAQMLATTFAGDPVIQIPHTYAAASNNRFIVQDKLEGVWLSELFARNLNADQAAEYVRQQVGSNVTEQLYQLGYKSLYASLSGKLVHGDPHPGNIVLMPNNQVGFIDFGIVGYPVRNRLALIDYIKIQISGKEGKSDIPRLMLGIVRFHASYLYRAIQSLAEYYKRPLFDEFYTFLQQEVADHQDSVDEESIANGQYSDMLSAAINKNNRFALIPKVDTPVTQKAFITLWRTFEELGFEAVTLEVFKDVVTAIEGDFETDAWKELPLPIDKAFEVIGEWLATVAEKDPALFASLKAIFH